MVEQPPLIADVAELEEQFAQLQFTSLTHEDALALGMDRAARAEERNWPMAVSVYLGDQHVFRYACPGTSSENDEWLERKRRTVYKFHEPTFLIGQRFAAKGKDFYVETGLPNPDYVPYGGGFPLIVNGEFVGAILSSGVPHQDDHAIIVETLRAALEN